MNIVNRFLLRLALLPVALYRKIGVNTIHLKLILTAKLVMDDRRPNTFHQTRQRKSDKAISGATIGTMIMSALLGLLFLATFRISDELVTQLTFYFSVYIFMLASTLISDFTSVLIDIRDNYIILPKPVTDKTFVLSRLLHILIHVTKIILPMSIPGVIYMIIFRGYWPAFIFFLMILSATMFTVFLINIIYLAILKVTSPQKFQALISYIQIVMTILIFGGYQVIPQMVGKMPLGSFILKPNFWLWLLPSYWFALCCEFFSFLSLQPSLLFGSLLAILVPAFSLWMVIKYFAPSFNQKLSLITGTTEESVSLKKSGSNKRNRPLLLAERLSKIFAKKGEERMGFLITWKLTGRLRDFKLKVYPSIGYIAVLIVIMFFNNNELSIAELKSSNSQIRAIVISILYSSSFLLVLAIGQLQYSDKFKAAWFYFTMPIKKPGLIFSGALKAAVVKFYIPIMLLLSVLGIVLIGFHLLPNLVLGLLNVLLGCLILSLITLRNLPFSASQQTSQKAGVIFRGFLSMFMVFSLAIFHYIVYDILIVVIISIFLSALANWLLFDYLKNKSWTKVLDSYSH
ncbi:MAG: hypothetical protein ABIN89_06100 [Chitinophagaceae bacterium]